MADNKKYKVGITAKEPWAADISYESLDYTLWRVQDGGDGCGYIALKANIGVRPDSDQTTWIKASERGQSIYDLAVKYHHFDGTEEEFEAQYQAALAAAETAAAAASATDAQVKAAEAARVSAEQARAAAETARATAETARQTAEDDRDTAETARDTAETARANAETARSSAENARSIAEGERRIAENARESAEQTRARDTAAAITDANTARDQADAAAARATEAAAAANTAAALANEKAGDAETAATLANEKAALVQEKLDRADTDHTRAESDHTTAASDHTTAQNDHTQAGTDHTQAVSDQARAETDHTTATSDHATAEADHTTAAGDHTRAEEDHTRAEADHAIVAGYDTRLTNTENQVSQLGQKVTPPIYQDANSVYKDCFKELYYIGKLPTNISCRNYGNSIIFRGFNSSTGFSCRQDISTWQDGVIYPLTITTTNDSINYPIGAVVGYVIFNDIATFKANSLGQDTYYLNYPRICSPSANPSLLAMLTKVHKPVYINTADVYNDCIEEIYFFGHLPSAGISFRCQSNNVAIFRGFNPNNAFTCSLNPSSCTNGVICPLVITATNDSTNYPLNATVGYIRFKDIATFKANLSKADNRWLNSDIITNILNSPIILSARPISDGTINTAALADYAVTEIKIADKFIKVYSSSPDYDIRGMIAELYFKKDSVVFNDAGGYTNVVLKTYNGSLYIRPYNGTTSYGWNSTTPMSNYVNGTVYPIVVTANGVNTAYGIGDVVGYIVFKDIDALKNTSSAGNPGTVIRDNAIQLCYSPMIYSYINSQNIQIVGVVKFPEIQIPKDIYVVQGNQLMIFYKSIVKAYDNTPYGLRVVCSVGKAYPKYYLLQADTLGDYTATFYVVDNDDNIISQKATTIHCVSAMSAPSANKNVLVFGASATASGYIAGELKRRLTDNTGDGTPQNPTGLALSNIAFVGRKVGTMVNVNQEATGGWSWRDYSGTGRPAYRFNVSGVTQLNIGDTYTQNDVVLTITEINVTAGSGNIRCIYEGTNTLSATGTLTRRTGTGDATITYTSFDSESYNPFWNPNKAGGAGLDFQNYATLYCNGSIDVMISHCGLNDISRYTPATIQDLFTDYVKPFIRAYHTDFPNGKFIISTLPLPSPTGGMGANYGASAYWNWLTTSLKLWAFSVEAEKLVEDAEFSSYVYLADDVPVFDCEHSYPYAMAYVNNRSTEQEELGTNGVHPTSVGSYQVADAIYMTFNRMGLS